MAAYGGSAARADGVADHEAWSDVLARRLGCRVDNLAISGYGVDQAVLRLMTTAGDASQTIVLGIEPVDLMRNANQWPFLLGAADMPWALKPILVDMTGELDVTRPPDLTFAGFIGLTLAPARYLGHERYLPGSPWGPVVLEPPYALALGRASLKLLGSIDLGRVLSGDPVNTWQRPVWHEGGHGPAPELLALNDRVLGLFHQACRRRAARCTVVIFPDAHSLAERQATGRNLIEIIHRRLPAVMTVWDLLPELATTMGAHGVCHYFGRGRDCQGPLNADGNRLVADILERKLRPLNAADRAHGARSE